MKFLNLVLQSAFLILIALIIDSPAQTPQTLLPSTIEEEVVRLLRNRDVKNVADELAQQPRPRTTAGLLKNLSVFGRAGHKNRIHETLKQLPKAEDFDDTKGWVIQEVAQKAMGDDDLKGRKLYYELVAVHGDNQVDSFTSLWEKKGDLRELEKWLAARRQSPMWWEKWLQIKQYLGTADEIYAQMELEIRANPKDWGLIEKYIRSVTNSKRNTSWLAQTVPTDLAFDAYQLAGYLSYREPQIAAKLFEKSLSLPFTKKDEEKFWWYIARSFSMAPKIKNPEKQLRFWTKKALAETYRKNNQPQLAQPLVEELTAMDTGDIIQPTETFGLAGQVQAASGQRVVEAKILQEEAQKQKSPQYWIDRAQYYMGRKEKESVWETLEQALATFPYKAGDSNALSQRLQILQLVRWYGENAPNDKPKELFRREFSEAAKDSTYTFSLARIIGDDFDDFLDEFFTNQNLITRILADRPKWLSEEEAFIDNVMESERWEPAKRALIWDQLLVLARQDVRNRAFTLGKEMSEHGEYRKAIPLLEESLKIAPGDFEGDLNYNREYVQKELFDAYLNAGNWESAERMFRGGFNYWKDGLGRIALAAARAGSITDAVRLWKDNSKLDRRNLWHLEELGKTGAKNPLREFYLKMKESDPLTDVPDRALSLLK